MGGLVWRGGGWGDGGGPWCSGVGRGAAVLTPHLPTPHTPHTHSHYVLTVRHSFCAHLQYVLTVRHAFVEGEGGLVFDAAGAVLHLPHMFSNRTGLDPPLPTRSLAQVCVRMG